MAKEKIIEWEMSIGYPTAKRQGEIYLDEHDLQLLEDMTEEEQQEFIEELVWEDAMQYIEVRVTNI